MTTATTVYPAHISIRQKPVNLVEQDIALFEHEFLKEINATTIMEFANADILKETIFSLREFRFYKSLCHVFKVPKTKLYKKPLLFLLPYHRIEKGIWITDEWSPEYFHWLTDALPRLITVDEFSGKHTLILPASFKNKSYVKQSLELLSYDVYYYNRKKRLSVHQLFSATHTAESGNYNSEVINKLRTRLMKDDGLKPERKIYISRQKAIKRKITNEDEVTLLLLSLGYEIHFFEDYDLNKQIEIMGQTKILVGLHGAGLTNMLFMKSGGKILELRNEGDTHNNCYFSQASALAHDYYYQTSPGNTEDTNKVDITVDIDKLKYNLELMEQHLLQ